MRKIVFRLNCRLSQKEFFGFYWQKIFANFLVVFLSSFISADPAVAEQDTVLPFLSSVTTPLAAKGLLVSLWGKNGKEGRNKSVINLSSSAVIIIWERRV